MELEFKKWSPDENMIESGDGKHAICLNKDSQYANWIFYKHPDGQWVTLRMALPQETERAKKHLQFLKWISGEPCKP